MSIVGRRLVSADAAQPWLAASSAGPRAPHERSYLRSPAEEQRAKADASVAREHPGFERDPQPFTGARPIVPAPTDAELIAALQRGEEWAATALYDRVQGPVVRTLSRLLRQRQSAELEDLTQTTFERMIRFLTQRSLGGSCNLPGWSRAVATNVAIDFLRRDVSERRLFVPSESCVDELRSHDAQPESSLDSRTSLRRVQKIIAAMSPKYAETVVLHDVLGHDLVEIAEMMGATVAATQSRLVRGRKDLLRRAQREKKR